MKLEFSVFTGPREVSSFRNAYTVYDCRFTGILKTESVIAGKYGKIHYRRIKVRARAVGLSIGEAP